MVIVYESFALTLAVYGFLARTLAMLSKAEHASPDLQVCRGHIPGRRMYETTSLSESGYVPESLKGILGRDRALIEIRVWECFKTLEGPLIQYCYSIGWIGGYLIGVADMRRADRPT